MTMTPADHSPVYKITEYRDMFGNTVVSKAEAVEGNYLHAETRTEWAALHTARLKALFELPVLKEVPQRIWRTSYVDQHGDYVCVAVCQNLGVPASPNQLAPKVQTFVSRPYWHATNGRSGVQQDLMGHYSPREIVAFLGLDTIDPDSVEWKDETLYSDIIKVGGILSPMDRNS